LWSRIVVIFDNHSSIEERFIIEKKRQISFYNPNPNLLTTAPPVNPFHISTFSLSPIPTLSPHYDRMKWYRGRGKGSNRKNSRNCVKQSLCPLSFFRKDSPTFVTSNSPKKRSTTLVVSNILATFGEYLARGADIFEHGKCLALFSAAESGKFSQDKRISPLTLHYSLWI